MMCSESSSLRGVNLTGFLTVSWGFGRGGGSMEGGGIQESTLLARSIIIVN